MYSTILMLHSWIRWAVVLAGLYAVIRALAGWTGRRPWTAQDNVAGLVFTIVLDVQLLLGIWLYGISPFTTEALGGLGAAMRMPELRYWSVEHPFGMLVGIALAHVGRARLRRIADDVRRHRAAFMFFVLSLAFILASIPWPGTRNGRSLFF